jgi:hypothetical protein
VSDVPSRDEAVRILEEGRARTRELLEQVPRGAMTRPGLGGGTWSPKDLVGHLSSWEEHALDALHAWERGRRAPIDDLWRGVSTTRINRQEVERKARWPPSRVQREAERTFSQVLDAIRATSDERWLAPLAPRGRKPLALRLGGILGGPGGPFRHDEAHHPSLRTFLERLG